MNNGDVEEDGNNSSRLRQGSESGNIFNRLHDESKLKQQFK